MSTASIPKVGADPGRVSARCGADPMGNRIVALTHTSREVSWSLTHEALWPVVERALRVGPLPLIGTHDWIDLGASDPRRVGAIYLAAEFVVTGQRNQLVGCQAQDGFGDGFFGSAKPVNRIFDKKIAV